MRLDSIGLNWNNLSDTHIKKQVKKKKKNFKRTYKIILNYSEKQ